MGVIVVSGGATMWLLARNVGVGRPAKPRCPTQPAPDVGIGTGRGGPHWSEMAPSPLCGRFSASVAWTGRELLVWGGESCAGAACPNPAAPRLDDGAAYVPATDSWRRLASAPIGPRDLAATVWTGREMLVWGGSDRGRLLADGAAYDPASNRWRTLARSPISGRSEPVAVWTGREMLVWGGHDADEDGAAYDPVANRWRLIAPGPLAPRRGSAAAWTGREMVVWSGRDPDGHEPYDDGAAYDPATDRWRPIAEAPVVGRQYPGFVWTGRVLVVWGGDVQDMGIFNDGASYDPGADRWTVLPPSPLTPRVAPLTVFDDHEVIVWGGIGEPGDEDRPTEGEALTLGDGAAFDPAAGTWRPLEPVTLLGRGFPVGAWDGEHMIAWGGLVAVGQAASAADGALYTP